MKDKKETNKKISRRRFMGGAAAVTAFTIVPRYVLGGPGFKPPSEKLNIACIGVGGMGASDVQSVSGENIVALCDVDWSDYTAETFAKHLGAKKYKDFRRMLDAEDRHIDAVTVSTPDHTHAVAAMAAIKRGKHVYCQKPLCHDIYEVRQLMEAARKYGVQTQMGTQYHGKNEMKLFVEIVRSGVIGKIFRVDIWSGKELWSAGTLPEESSPIPQTLDWDLWLGPAPYRPYSPRYVPATSRLIQKGDKLVKIYNPRGLPGEWRRWWDFGTGTLGDMGCHIIDPCWWALDLTYPTSVEAEPGPFNEETYPDKTIVKWEFPAMGERPTVKVTWYDGANMPPRPKELEEGRRLPSEGGIYYGEDGVILYAHMSRPRLIPEDSMKGFKVPDPIFARDVDHYQDWIRACRGGPKPLANFDYSGPLTETVLLGNVAARAGQKLLWDGPSLKVTNVPEANQYLSREYRKGWML